MRRSCAAPASVVIADDQAPVRNGPVAILSTVRELDVVGVAKDGAGAVALAEHYNVDVVLIDLRMAGMDGLDATRALRARRHGPAVVVLTTYADGESIDAALAAGAAGCLTKNANPHQISRMLLAAARARWR